MSEGRDKRELRHTEKGRGPSKELTCREERKQSGSSGRSEAECIDKTMKRHRRGRQKGLLYIVHMMGQGKRMALTFFPFHSYSKSKGWL